MDKFAELGWVHFPFDPALAVWAAHADRAAQRAEAAPPPDMLRCGGTWFVGVNALANNEDGCLPGGPPLVGQAMTAVRKLVGRDITLDRAQASVCYHGYPQQGQDEDEAAFRFRRNRDAAHVDGLHRIMPGRRRMLREVHGFILGIPLNDPPEGAAPLTVWEGSHEIMRSAFAKALSGHPPHIWADLDVTEIYHSARAACFQNCPRRLVPARRGEAYLVHRLALHGVAPWGSEVKGRRAIAYFRPDLSDTGWADHGDDWWLTAP